jgi:hypothetical protein
VKFDTYHFIDSDVFLGYDFFSQGPNGNVAKRVIYKPMTENEDVFVLTFGDLKQDKDNR